MKTDTLLMLGYAIPFRVGDQPKEMHWDALLLPRLPGESGKPPPGFRPNALGWWRRDRAEAFADGAKLEYVHADNWSSERLQARGRLPLPLRNARVAIIGVGALGSMLAEFLVRAGLANITLFDHDIVAAGNVCRHVVTLQDVGRTKVAVLRDRLHQISPHVRVTAVDDGLFGSEEAVVATLERYEVVVDCTASEEVISLLALGWWSIPRLFVSFSLGLGAKRLFSFGTTGHEFPREAFLADLAPWLEDEVGAWAGEDELLEGAGCWSPLFPARHDDVAVAAAVCVKELEALTAQRPREPRFRVFEKQESHEGFGGFAVQREPPPAQNAAP